MTPKYSFKPAFESGVVHYLATNSEFAARYMEYLHEDLFTSPQGKLVYKIVKGEVKTNGTGYASLSVFEQRLHREHVEGRIDIATHDATFEYVVLGGWTHPDAQALEKELAVTLQAYRKGLLVTDVMMTFAKKGDIVPAVEQLLKVEEIGKAKAAVKSFDLDSNFFSWLKTQAPLDYLPTGADAIDALTRGGMPRRCAGLIIGATGGGKCCRAGTPTLMADGTVKPVEQVRVGDLLAGYSGPRRVLRTNTGRGLMYEVRPVKGDSFYVNVDHILTVVHTSTGAVIDVTVKDWLEWSPNQKHRYKLFSVVPELTDAGGSRPVDPYLLGALLGDGSFGDGGVGVGVTTADAKMVREVRRQAKAWGLKVSVRGRERSAPFYAITTGNRGQKNPLLEALESLGLCGARAGAKFIPDAYKRADQRTKLELLAGLMDTGGHVHRSSFDYVSKSEVLVNDIAYVARSLGFKVTVSPCRKSCQTGAEGRYYRASIVGPCDTIPCKIKRCPPRLQKKNHLRTGFTVVPTGIVDDYYGFTLDGDGRYLLGDFVVTHNSMYASQVAATALVCGLNLAYISLEIGADMVGRRLAAALSGIPIDLVAMNCSWAEAVIEARANKRGAFRFAKMEGLGTTITDIRKQLRIWCQELGISGFDVIVIDYVDRIAGITHIPRETNGYVLGGQAMQALHDIGEEHNGVVWTPSQATRQKNAVKQDLSVDDSADSMHKPRIADTVITINLNKASTYVPGSNNMEVTGKIVKDRNSKGHLKTPPQKPMFAYGYTFPSSYLRVYDPKVDIALGPEFDTSLWLWKAAP